MKEQTITIKTFFGLEEVLREELDELGYKDVKVLNRAVQLKGTWEDVYKLNLHLRCALAVLVEIETFRIREEEDLYKKAKKIDWTSYFDVDKSFAIKGAVFSTIFKHSQYPFLLVKDAIVDCFMDRFNERPNVQLKSPQLLFDLYINDQDVTISLNTSGVPLYQRGYRQETGLAPINEVLAAGMIRLSGWDRKSTFVDPFCGSGTLLIEAALLATGIPSCIERTHFAFKNFKNYDEACWEGLLTAARRLIKNWDSEALGFELIGSDIDSEMIFKTKANLRALPISRAIKLKVGSFDELELTDVSPGILMCNPPYGQRLRIGEEDIETNDLYTEMGSWFKKELKGFTCWVISSNYDALKCVGLKPARKIKLYNGDLECSFRSYEIFEGSNKDFKTQLANENNSTPE